MVATYRLRHTFAALAGYVLLACGLTWPLPQRFQTHFLGDTSGDVGVYVWNLWIFRHELVEHGRLPVSTDHLFSYTGAIDFALHNYTPLAGLLGVPLIDWLGIVGTFNVIVIAAMVLSALGMFLLARHLGLAPVYAWIAGALFIASPVMTARGSEHFSLITAAPLPLFIWALLRALETRRVRDAMLVGVFVAAATYSDAYYGIYCVMAGAVFVGWRFIRLVPNRRSPKPVVVAALHVCIAVVALLIGWRVITGSTLIVFAGIRIGLQTLYTPVFALTTLIAVRAWVAWRPTWTLHDPDRVLRVLLARGAIAVAVCLVCLTPLLAGLAFRYMDDRLPESQLHWRSSDPGVDLAAYVVPNPLHPWFGHVTRSWFGAGEAFPEFVASFSLVAFAVIGAGAAMRVLPRVWIVFTGLFMLLSAGPFINVAGVNTFVPGPWAFLRYVPILGMARAPSRFTVLAVLGLSILFAAALSALARGMSEWKVRPAYVRTFSVALVLALVIELLPAPRVLYSAEVPEVYQLITATTDEAGRVLELPTGMRDGTSSMGRFNPASQYFQTRHHRPLVGGYVSRVSPWRRRETRRAPVLNAIFELSEGHPVSAGAIAAARDGRDAFLRRTCVRFVVVNKQQASEELRAFASATLRLMLVHEDLAYQLLTPIDPPPCEAPRARAVRGRSASVK
jgi:hypothetical protein